MTQEELYKAYGEAVFQIKIWQAKIVDFERQLIELENKKSAPTLEVVLDKKEE